MVCGQKNYTHGNEVPISLDLKENSISQSILKQCCVVLQTTLLEKSFILKALV